MAFEAGMIWPPIIASWINPRLSWCLEVLAETFRYAEAFARGCCVITDEPPGQWWHEGSPARFIQDWNQVGEVIQETLASTSETTHLDNRRYYQQKLSPKAIADYIEGVVREACS